MSCAGLQLRVTGGDRGDTGDRSVKAGRSARDSNKVSSDNSQGGKEESMESNSTSKAPGMKKSKQKRLSLKVLSKVKTVFLFCLVCGQRGQREVIVNKLVAAAINTEEVIQRMKIYIVRL